MNRLLRGSIAVSAGISKILTSMPVSAVAPKNDIVADSVFEDAMPVRLEQVRRQYERLIETSAIPDDLKQRLISTYISQLRDDKESIQSDMQVLASDWAQLGTDMKNAEKEYVKRK